MDQNRGGGFGNEKQNSVTGTTFFNYMDANSATIMRSWTMAAEDNSALGMANSRQQ